MQERYLKDISLYKITPTKQTNGTYINTYTLIDTYRGLLEALQDEISASIYGSLLNKMYRIRSVKNALELYLESIEKISEYCIVYNNMRFKVVSVKDKYIDIEYTEKIESSSI